MLHIMFDEMVAGSLEQSESRGCNVELGDLVLLNDVPVSREIGVRGGTLKDEGRHTEQERSVDAISVTGNPTNITCRTHNISLVDIEDVLPGHGSAQEVSGSRVHDTLGGTSRTRGVEQEQRILRGHECRGAVTGVLGELLVPPEITTFGHGHLRTCPLEDEHIFDVRALLKRIVNDPFCADGLSTTLSLVCCNDNPRVGILDAVPQGSR